MDEPAWYSSRGHDHDRDLASIVLADERAVDRHASRTRRFTTSGGSGYDARSVLVLAIVIALFAAIVGWAMTLTREPVTTLPPASTAQDVSAAREAAPTTEGTTAAASSSKDDAVAAAPAGVQLAPGRITGARSASGGGILRVAVANRGDVPLDSATGVQVTALVNGELVGSAPLGAIDAAGSAAVELYLDSCPAGRAAITAIVDATDVQREGNERDNARIARVPFGC